MEADNNRDTMGLDSSITVSVAKAAATGEFRRRVVTRLWGSPWVLGPLVLGTSALMGNWALNLQSGGLAFGGLAALLAAGGIFLTRLLLGGESLSREVAQELADSALHAQEVRLLEIQRGLLADNDPTNDHYLKDLKAVVAAFRQPTAWPDNLDSVTRAAISDNVERIFDCCFRQLEKAQTLWQTVQRIQTPAARTPILLKRTQLLEEVGNSLKNLSGALAGLNAIGVATEFSNDSENGEAQRLQTELEQNLRVARAAEKRMIDLEREIGGRV